ncbi:STAS domain-containing protein [Streptomyces sp. NBC_01723]|uniref:STAS domain-containing protein n=1 Tax=unclassified Streptomyces TaxID=2593676 RepID=UPI002783B481|nr:MULTISPECIES: STAS domain-containing protein [unclassified Streptomyces]MDQ0407222.1 anti-sigma B factor antagonist [Streptomyces sp. DSM 40167]
MGVEAEVTVTTVDEVRIVQAVGEFDPDSDESLALTLVPSADRPAGTVLDLAKVTFADSAFLHTLLAAKTEHDRVGVPFVLTQLPPVVERLLTLTDVARAFDLTSDIGAAVALIRSRGDAAHRQ